MRALNLPEHRNNIIHTDAGAQAAGYPRALVAGVTVYAYLTHLPVMVWGEAWLTAGAAEVRFRNPVFDDDLVECVAVADGTGRFDAIIEAWVGDEVKATLALRHQASNQGGAAMAGEVASQPEELPPMAITFDGEFGDYSTRAGDTQTVSTGLGLVHPVAWPVLGNRVTMANLVTGPWIHVRSAVAHLGAARVGTEAVLASAVIRRFESRAGHRAVLDITVASEGQAIARIEHESIIDLKP